MNYWNRAEPLIRLDNMQPEQRFSSFQIVTDLASRRPVHMAFAWIHNNPGVILDWQSELTSIPAPPFGEEARGAWIAERFQQIGLDSVRTDEVGNVFGILPAAAVPPESTGPVVLLSAHLDTVFPANTVLQPRIEGNRLMAPGVCDNGAGLAGLLAVAQALVKAEYQPAVPLVFLANVGEEGEGNLRGVRHFYTQDKLSERVSAHVVLDGAGTESVVTRALGSRRFRITISGPGGHSFSDAGTPNPISALSFALSELARIPLPGEPRTTFNIGSVQGGTSVNAIPQNVQASIDFRSTSPAQLNHLETVLRKTVTASVQQINQAARHAPGSRGSLEFQIEEIGDRPAAVLPADSELFATLHSVDRHLGLRTETMLGSTDANIPLSLGVPSLSMGAGGDGGGAHTLEEWYSDRDRETGLKRVILLTLAMTEWTSRQ